MNILVNKLSNQYAKLRTLKQVITDLALAYLKSIVISKYNLGVFIYTEYYTINLYDLNKYDSYFNDLKSNKISYVDPKNCLKAILANYKVTSSSPIPTVKIDWATKESFLSSDVDKPRLNEISFQILDPIGYSTVDISTLEDICTSSDSYFDFYVYSPYTTEQQLTTYNTYKELGIDVYNQTQPFFNSKCYIFKNSTNEMDVPLVTRKTDIFLGTSYICGDGCTFSGSLTDTNYIICNCAPSFDVKIYIEQKSFTDYSLTNMDIINCANGSLNLNTGFIILIILLIVALVTIILICFFLRKYLRRNFKEVIYADCNTLISKNTIDKHCKT
jgi:hypothetical protein